MVQGLINIVRLHPLLEAVLGIVLFFGGSTLLLIIGAYIGNTIDNILEERNMAYIKKQVNIDNIKKNEYGQYIVDDLTAFERGKIYRAVKNKPCDPNDEFKCLECPFTDCLAPAYITNKSSGDFTKMTDGIKGKYDSPYYVKTPYSTKRGAGTRNLVQDFIATDK